MLHYWRKEQFVGKSWLFIMPPSFGTGGIMFWFVCLCPSEVQKATFPPVHRSVVPSNPDQFSICPFVRPSVCLFRKVSRHIPENAWEEWVEFGMLMYPDQLQSWLYFGYGLLIFAREGEAYFLVLSSFYSIIIKPSLWVIYIGVMKSHIGVIKSYI